MKLKPPDRKMLTMQINAAKQTIEDHRDAVVKYNGWIDKRWEKIAKLYALIERLKAERKGLPK